MCRADLYTREEWGSEWRWWGFGMNVTRNSPTFQKFFFCKLCRFGNVAEISLGWPVVIQLKVLSDLWSRINRFGYQSRPQPGLIAVERRAKFRLATSPICSHGLVTYHHCAAHRSLLGCGVELLCSWPRQTVRWRKIRSMKQFVFRDSF